MTLFTPRTILAAVGLLCSLTLTSPMWGQQPIYKYALGGINHFDWIGTPCPAGSTQYNIDTRTENTIVSGLAPDDFKPYLHALCYAPNTLELTFTVVEPGLYTVRLYFIDPNMTASATRAFDVRINDTLYNSGVDIWKSVGQMKEHSIGYSVVTTNRKIVIKLNRIIRNAILSGVQLDIVSSFVSVWGCAFPGPAPGGIQ